MFGRTSRTSPEYRAGNAFQQFCEAWARECLRVLKPGGHLLCFGGSRTYHRMACAIEDAGFEIRDQIMYRLYGSGFPKSLNLDRERGDAFCGCEWRVNTSCHVCSNRMYRRPWQLTQGKGRYCSTACRNKAHPLPFCNAPPPPSGPANQAWKGGVTIFKKKGNYINVPYVRAPEWAKPMARGRD